MEVPERKQYKEEDSRGKLIGWRNKEGKKRESRNQKMKKQEKLLPHKYE
jgi:hypothetical protein